MLDELARDSEFEFRCLVDSVAGVELLENEKSGPGSNFSSTAAGTGPGAKKFEPGPNFSRPLDVLLECGMLGARTGCRTLEEALAVARRVAASPALRLVGVEGFEGAIHGANSADTEAKITQFVAFIGEVAAACAAENLIDADPIVLSAGGSAYFDIVTRLPREFSGRKAQVLIRSGCYLTHDSDAYAKAALRMRERMPEIASLGEGLRDALEVWSYVQSLPEPGLAIVTMGRRDVSFDQHLPFPRLVFRPGMDSKPRALESNDAGSPLSRGRQGEGEYSIFALNDQHGFMRVPPGHGLAVGDMIGCTIAHPCTTFDKWRFMPIVDDDYNVIDSVTTWF